MVVLAVLVLFVLVLLVLALLKVLVMEQALGVIVVQKMVQAVVFIAIMVLVLRLLLMKLRIVKLWQAGRQAGSRRRLRRLDGTPRRCSLPASAGRRCINVVAGAAASAEGRSTEPSRAALCVFSSRPGPARPAQVSPEPPAVCEISYVNPSRAHPITKAAACKLNSVPPREYSLCGKGGTPPVPPPPPPATPPPLPGGPGPLLSLQAGDGRTRTTRHPPTPSPPPPSTPPRPSTLPLSPRAIVLPRSPLSEDAAYLAVSVQPIRSQERYVCNDACIRNL
ncbi:uncharacterized protein LOC126260668 [Schistocerca nitens]|uniref:uncharacterized protein LOC126260668 n=1 Tax=Schistocerca nitens TaxID=7011 RepID=UPI002118FFBD|nr:uncharacterized protein LOC126260668 [Schistocerca nitens]